MFRALIYDNAVGCIPRAETNVKNVKDIEKRTLHDIDLFSCSYERNYQSNKEMHCSPFASWSQSINQFEKFSLSRSIYSNSLFAMQYHNFGKRIITKVSMKQKFTGIFFKNIPL